MPTAHPLHGLLDPPGDQGPAHPGGGRGGHLHPQPQPAPRGGHGPTVALQDHLDAGGEGRPHDHLRQGPVPLPARPGGPPQQAPPPVLPVHEQNPGEADPPEIRNHHQSGGHEGHHAVLHGPQPVQRLQVPVRGNRHRPLPHAVVRPTQQIHAAKGN